MRRRLSTELAPIVGRDAELHALSESVQSGTERLISLVGPAGVGKSRLVASVVSQLTHVFAHGTHLVDLAAAREVDDVVGALSAVATPPGAPPGPLPTTAGVAAALRNRALLIALDNCEHLRAEIAELTVRLVAECPGLQLLVASGEPLGVYGEQLFAVRPLPVPDPAVDLPVEDLARVPAVALFLHRGAAVRPTFALTADNADAVAELCRQLDGLPLAIELAASRLKILHPQSLLAKVRDGLDVLENLGSASPARYRSMRDVLTAVCERLPEDARTLLAALGVFSSTFSLEAMEAVSGLPAGAACVHLELLIDRSVVLADDNSPHELQFSLLRTTRIFALERLHATGTVGAVRHRHADYFLARVAKRLTGQAPTDEKWFAALEREHDDLTAALAFLVDEGRGRDAMVLATGLTPHWQALGQPRAGLRWLGRALEAGEGTPGKATADSLRAAGELAARSGAAGDAVGFLRKALAQYRTLGDTAGVVATVHQLGTTAYLAGDLPRARRLLGQAARMAAGEEAEPPAILLDLAALGVAEGNAEAAAGHAAAALTRLEAAADPGGNALARTGQADIAVARRQFADAEAHCRDAVDFLRKALAQYRTLGDAAHLAGELPQARRLLEQAARMVAGEQAVPPAILLDLAALGVAEGNAEAAACHAATALTRLETAADAGAIAVARTRQAEIAVARRQFADAEAHCQAAVPVLADLRAWDALACCWELLAAAMAEDGSGRVERAAQLLSAAQALRETYRQPGPAGRQPLVRRLVDQVRRQLGPMMFAEAWHTGRALPVRAVADETGPGMAARQPTLDLTPRQRQVAELVAAGLTNREIAKKLGVAEWTAVNHVRQVLRKLKCSSRVQVARWFFQQEHPR